MFLARVDGQVTAYPHFICLSNIKYVKSFDNLFVFQLKMCIFVAAYERRAQRTLELLLGSKRVVCCIRQCAQAIF